MTSPKIQLLVFDGCPLAPAARLALQQAIEVVGPLEYEEIDILDPQTPEDLRDWGSPTILVNGRDVTGASKGDGVGCRVYTNSGKVPEVTTIADILQEAQS